MVNIGIGLEELLPLSFTASYAAYLFHQPHLCSEALQRFGDASVTPAWYLAFGVCFAAASILNDMRITRLLPLDSVTQFVVIITAFPWIAAHSTVSLPWVFAFLTASCLSTLERFCIGAYYHATARIETHHMAFHDDIQRRRATSEYRYRSHIVESIWFTGVLAGYLLLLSAVEAAPVFTAGFLSGWLLEHFLSYKLRLQLQYNGAIQTSVEFRDWRFLRNAYAFYWQHIDRDTQTCFGFTSPYWDQLFGRCPFRPCLFSSPLPFVDFFIADYDAWHASEQTTPATLETRGLQRMTAAAVKELADAVITPPSTGFKPRRSQRSASSSASRSSK